jgi:urease accessory protein UreE
MKDESEGFFTLMVNLEGNKEVMIRLPTPKELKKGEIIYTENMMRLFTMQDAVIEALTNVTPVTRENKNAGLLKLILMRSER